MHLLRSTAGSVTEGQAVDLQQSPADIVFLSAADSDLAGLATAQAQLTGPSLRLANLMQLSHPMSVDLYIDQVIQQARLVIVRVLGGISYWRYGLEQIETVCKAHNIAFAALPGDDQPDPELSALSTLTVEQVHRLWQYCVHGGQRNAEHLLRYAASFILPDATPLWREPTPLPRAGIYWPKHGACTLEMVRKEWHTGRLTATDDAVVVIVFYRALLQSTNLAAVDALINAIIQRNMSPLPLYCTSLKNPLDAAMIQQWLRDIPPGIVLNTLGFSVSSPGSVHLTPFDVFEVPVLQVIFATSESTDWEQNNHGLGARDIAMHVALPEVDGRIVSRAVSFKAQTRYDQLTQCAISIYEPLPDRMAFVADLAHAWLQLRRTPPAQRRIAIILANYPNRDGRLANGVGLDTPNAMIVVLQALLDAGYRVVDVPQDGNALIEALRRGPTNAAVAGRTIIDGLSLAAYLEGFQRLPERVQAAIEERWGAPQTDPSYAPERQAFALSVLCYGNVTVGLQPARGYHIDPLRSYHDPDLVPPHGYLAFYFWLRYQKKVQAMLHMGKHGSLEWLPGKAVALSETCFPEVLLGALPHIYPFIVNDPGEGTQAKRRAQAVIIDHLTPPLTRAENYGTLEELERLVDEYYQAAGVDPRRLKLLHKEILAWGANTGVSSDCGIDSADSSDKALEKIDNYLCELKELQIRDGLHILGRSPEGDLRDNLLAALVQLPRGFDKSGDASLSRAIARDLQLVDFDPLSIDQLGAPWNGKRPAALAALDTTTPWRSLGDTVERIRQLGLVLISGKQMCLPEWQCTKAVLAELDNTIAPQLDACGEAEIAGLLTALEGHYVAPGPSGAPTRGRLEVLPTGRNFYSIDTRTVPTPTAWQLGWQSASLLVEYHRQQQGEWPRRMVISLWGTANMRTGGDDIAQALALLGVKPQWDQGSGRVSGFEILPSAVLDRPRVDVVLRVSGFFRDAFPAQIALLDAAICAVAALDEPASINPLSAVVNTDAKALQAAGENMETAKRRASYRIFGAKPGAYGAGLQALIDEHCWSTDQDLARAYIAWGGYAYGDGSYGKAEHRLFEKHLAGVEAVVHNQDNREHDLLDSDDYYQFEGGVAAAVRYFSGHQPNIYHNDHSNPEKPRINTLEYELGRVVRARAVNPKWIAGVMRHGYKGGFELAATVDYLFAFAATAKTVRNHHFDLVFEAYLNDSKVRNFLATNNDAALREISQRLLEAIDRRLWQPRSNAAVVELKKLALGDHTALAPGDGVVIGENDEGHH